MITSSSGVFRDVLTIKAGLAGVGFALMLMFFLAGRSTVLAVESLRAMLQPDAVQLQVHGGTNQDYLVQTNLSLGQGSWSMETLIGTDASGSSQFADTNSYKNSPKRFYRALPLPPIQTATSNATVLINTNVIVMLAAIDGSIYSGSQIFSVLTLPAGGQLFQFDGTPITSTNTLVSDPQHRLRYVPDTNAAPATITFNYRAARQGGVWSPSQSVSVSISALAPQPTTPRVQVNENMSVIFPFTANDPNFAPGAGPITFIIDFPPLQGRLYQVAADDVTRGPVILSQEVIISNTNNLVMYLPSPHIS